MKLSFYPSSAAEDIALCLCMSYTSACVGRDDFIPEEYRGLLRGAVMLIAMLCWFTLSLINGLRMKKRFAAGMCICLWLPPVIQLEISLIRPLKFSDGGLLTDKACRIITRLPFAQLESVTGINGNIFSAMTALLGLMLFGAGYLYTKKMLQGFERNDIL